MYNDYGYIEKQKQFFCIDLLGSVLTPLDERHYNRVFSIW